jgi:hypothetical protein
MGPELSRLFYLGVMCGVAPCVLLVLGWWIGPAWFVAAIVIVLVFAVFIAREIRK